MSCRSMVLPTLVRSSQFQPPLRIFNHHSINFTISLCLKYYRKITAICSVDITFATTHASLGQNLVEECDVLSKKKSQVILKQHIEIQYCSYQSSQGNVLHHTRYGRRPIPRTYTSGRQGMIRVAARAFNSLEVFDVVIGMHQCL